MMRIFVQYSRQTGASGNISDIQKKIIDVYSAFKHVTADLVGSSSGSGILESGEKNVHNNAHYLYLIVKYVTTHMTG